MCLFQSTRLLLVVDSPAQCYLRLSSPPLAELLVALSSESPKAQIQGLDGEGGEPSAERKAVVVELVTGQREELYWGKVPEKVRRQAVAKAVASMRDQETTEGTETSEEQEGRKRKRRRGCR